MKFLFESDFNKIDVGVLFIGLTKEQLKKEKTGKLKEILSIAEKIDFFKGEEGQSSLLSLPLGFKAKKVSLIGLGKEKELTKDKIRKLT